MGINLSWAARFVTLMVEVMMFFVFHVNSVYGGMAKAQFLPNLSIGPLLLAKLVYSGFLGRSGDNHSG